MVFGNSLSQRFWIASMESRWNSSGKSSQDSLHCRSSTRFKRWWLNQSVNLSSSKEGSSSCQCSTTLYGENEETPKNVLRILLQLRIMLADSCLDVGHVWDLDQRGSGTELALINQTAIGTRLLKEWCSTLPKAVTLYFVPPAPWKEGN